ncbi:MAG: ribonuclease III [Rickettsiales bacterium]|nr:ribonuclease III [Rickettsiales bacterium]
MKQISDEKIRDLEQKIGYNFRNRSLLAQALTHPSTKKTLHSKDYERLEFLGDSVISLLVSEILYQYFPFEDEGALAKRRASLVCREGLSEIAQNINLGEYLIISAGEEGSGGRHNKANLENCFEALVAAIYVDNGINSARDFIDKFLKPFVFQAKEPPKDPKSKLQEWAQKNGFDLPKYDIVSITGPAHQPDITIELKLNDKSVIKNSSSRKDAERMAAEEMLKILDIENAK